MTTNRSILAIALASTLMLAACQGNAPSTTAANPAASGEDKGFIASKVDEAIAQARKELATKNIDISHVNIQVNGHEASDADRKLPKAEITPQGDLLIEGKAVDVTPAQHALLLEYRGEIIAVADAGMAIGSKGAGMAGDALGGVVGAIFGGEKGQKEFEARMEAKGKLIEAEAMKLCDQLPAMLQTQQKLAAELPAFKPYANMSQSDIDDCRKHDKGDGVAVFSDADRDQVREEIRHEVRDGIRESIRSAVRTPSSDDSDSHDDAAAEADAAAAKGAD